MLALLPIMAPYGNANAGMPKGSRPRNLDYYLNRMSGYSKNTIKIQPQTKETYNPGDTVIFRLPTNSILDLHTLNMKFAGCLVNVSGSTCKATFPRFTQSFIRRFDITMGGMQVGLGSLHDYRALYALLGAHKIPANRFAADLDVTDQGSYLTDYATVAAAAGGVNGQSSWCPMTISSWLGLASGQFMRFLVS